MRHSILTFRQHAAGRTPRSAWNSIFSIRRYVRLNPLLAGLALTLGLAALSGCKPQPAQGQQQQQPPPPPVTVTRPVERDVVKWDEFNGRLEAVESVEVRARVSGMVLATPFQEGAVVKEGDVLVELDLREFQADLESKIAARDQAAAQVELARINYTHTKDLREGEAASVIEYQNSEAKLKAAQAALAGAEADVQAARLNVEWCRVTAPIPGRVSRKFVTVGNMVTGGSGTGTLLTTITSIDPIYCYVDVDERSIIGYQRMAQDNQRMDARASGIPCRLQISDETGFPHEGYIDFVDNHVNPDTGSIWLRGVFPNPDGWLTPGFFARVSIPGSDRFSTVLIPDQAVTTDQNEKQVLLVAADDTVQARAVKLGPLFGELRAVVSGLDVGDRVIVNGLMRARPGVKVSPEESEIPDTMLEPRLLGLANSDAFTAALFSPDALLTAVNRMRPNRVQTSNRVAPESLFAPATRRPAP
jgi:membrane fusion protein, multidrug efflux system